MTVAAVAAGSAMTVAAAEQTLRRGGNAFDAVVAAGFAAAVAEPCLTSLAGGGFLLASTRTDAVLYDFFVDVPGIGRRSTPPPMVHIDVHFGHATQVFHVGASSVAVPGVLAGYLGIHERLGRLPLHQVVAPAVASADQGFPVGRSFAGLVALLDPTLSMTDEGRALFRREGRPVREGDHFANPALAAVLHAIGSGARGGFTSEELAGTVTSADLHHYEMVEREPLRIRFRDAEVITNPSPSLGGQLLAHGLGLLESSPDADVLRLAKALVSTTDERHRLGQAASRGTTHISVADHEGNVASMTTSNGSGSGVFAPGTGIQLNNMMGEDDLVPGGLGSVPPGARVGSMMTPTVVVRPDGHRVALGSGGSERIRSTIVQLVAGLVPGQGERSLHDVIASPRLHWDGSTLQVEPGLSPAALDALADRYPVNQWAAADLYFGGAHSVTTTGEAVGDPRRQGVGLVLDPPA